MGIEMDIVDKMIQYMDKRDCSILMTNSIYMSREDLGTVITYILSWLQLEHKRKLWISQGRRTKHKPLELNFKYPWCNDLKTLLEKEEEFKNCFVIKNNKLDFLDSIPEKDKMLAWEKAYYYHMYLWQFREQKR